MRKLKLYLILFMFVFGPVFRPIGNWFDIIFIISATVVAFGLFFNEFRIPKKAYLMLLPLLVSAFTLVTLVSLPDYSTSDVVRQVLKPIRIGVTFLAGYFIIKITFEKWKLDKESIFLILFLVFSTHSLLMVYQFVNPSFKDWIYSLTFVGEFRSSFDYNFRMGGLSGGSGGSILSSVQSIGLLIPFFVWKNAKAIDKLIYTALSPIVLISILLSGRSGIWVLALAILFLSLLRTRNVFRFCLNLFLTLILAIVGLILLVKGFEYLEPESDAYYAISRSLDTFIEFKESGQFGDSGFSQYKNFFELPNELRIWVFGDPEHLINDQFGRKLDSDIGYIRNLWSFGLFGALVFLSPVFSLLFDSFSRPREVNKFLAVILFIMILLHAKESGFYVRMLWSIVSLFWGLTLVDDQSKDVSNEDIGTNI